MIREERKLLNKLITFFKLFYKRRLGNLTVSGKAIHSNSQKVRVCKITGENISDQRIGSKFLSAKKIGYLNAHKLRNRESNPRNNLKRKILKLKNQPSLFEPKEVLKLNTEQKKLLHHWWGTKYEINID